jgi:hypothetical protein
LAALLEAPVAKGESPIRRAKTKQPDLLLLPLLLGLVTVIVTTSHRRRRRRRELTKTMMRG